MNFALNDIGWLLVTAAIVAMVARRARVPYAVGLVIAGAALAAAGLAPQLRLSRELVYLVFLPPLVFEAALYLDWRELRRDLVVIGVLATVGVLIAATITAAGMHYLAGWPLATAACFGALIAATDPVSVIATFKEAGVRGRLRMLVEAESLFNDATAAILFGVALAFAAGTMDGPVSIGASLVMSIGGGIAAGALIAWIAVLFTRHTDDHLIEVTITTVAAYASFLLAERFHGSGVLASLTAGLIMGNVAMRGAVSENGRAAVTAFWDYAAFLVNSFVFLLIGVQITREHIASLALEAGIAIALVLVARAATIYPLSALFARTPLRVSAPHQHMLFWGGLRGALALALALGLPESLPQRDHVVTITFAVAAFSIIVQGTTTPMLLRRLGEIGSAGSGKA